MKRVNTRARFVSFSVFRCDSFLVFGFSLRLVRVVERRRRRRRIDDDGSTNMSSVTIAIPIPIDDDEVRMIAEQSLRTNAVEFPCATTTTTTMNDAAHRHHHQWEKAQQLEEEDYTRGMTDAMRIARTASLTRAETSTRTREEIIGRLRALDGATARAFAGYFQPRREGAAAAAAATAAAELGDARAHVSPGCETAAFALVLNALREAHEEATCDAGARVTLEVLIAATQSVGDASLGRAAGGESYTGTAAAANGGGESHTGSITDSRDATCDAMFSWAVARGASFGFDARVVGPGMREARATSALSAGGDAARVPWNALLGVDQTIGSNASGSPLCETLKQLAGLGEQTLMVIWLAAHLDDEKSEWAPAIRALPRKPSTALMWDSEATTSVLGETQGAILDAYRQKVRAQYDALFPMLCAQVPEAFPEKIFGDYSRFALAYDIWTSYAMKVQDPDTLELREVIVPGVYLCNHALYAHSVRYTKLERGSKAFRLELARSVAPGEALTISYGRLDNADLITYYGFSLASNPYDSWVMYELQFEEMHVEALKRASDAAGHDLTTSLPPRLVRASTLDRFLAQIRARERPQEVIHSCDTDEDYHPFVVTDGESECRMLSALCEHLSAQLSATRARSAALSSMTAPPHVNHIANATFGYRSGQINIGTLALEKFHESIAHYSRRKRTRDCT